MRTDRGAMARAGTGLLTVALAASGYVVASGDQRMKLGGLAADLFALGAIAGVAIAVVARSRRWSRFGPRIAGIAGMLVGAGAVILVPFRTLEACACASPAVEVVPAAPAVAGLAAHDFVALTAIAVPLMLLVATRRRSTHPDTMA